MPSPKLFSVICSVTLAGVVLFSAGSFAQATPLDYTIEATFPAPGPRPQDITWDGANLWVVDDSTDVIYRLDPEDCSVLQTFPAPDGNTQGLTWHEGRLWASGADSLTVYRLDPLTGEVLSATPWKYGDPVPSSDFHGTGITFRDGQFLFCMHAGMGSMICTFDLESREWDELVFVGYFPLGLLYAEGYVWYCGDGMGISPGAILGYLRNDEKPPPFGMTRALSASTPGYYPSGLAYDGLHYWMTDSHDRNIMKMVFRNTLAVSDDTPAPLELLQNRPNPFNASTVIPYRIEETGAVTLTVYSASGQKVATLVNGPLSAGTHSATFNGSKLASGVYFYRFESAGLTRTGKMLLLK